MSEDKETVKMSAFIQNGVPYIKILSGFNVSRPRITHTHSDMHLRKERGVLSPED